LKTNSSFAVGGVRSAWFLRLGGVAHGRIVGGR
jgi:hypothetical protein